MATLTAQTITHTGTQLSYDPASAGGDQLRPGPRTVLLVSNTSEADVVLTLVTAMRISGDLPVADREITVPAGGGIGVSMTDTSLYADPADGGLATILYSDPADLTVAVVRI